MNLSLIQRGSLFLALVFMSPLTSYAEDQSYKIWTQSKDPHKMASSWASPQNDPQQPIAIPELENLRRRMGEFLNQGLEDFQRKGYLNDQNTPQTDILEKAQDYYLIMDLPGIAKKDINIEVKGQDILISGERKVDEEFKESNLIKIERQYGDFNRTFTVPDAFIADEISAKYENGVLQVKIPKEKIKENIKPKTISIS